MPDRQRPSKMVIVRRALRLRCPLCGEVPLAHRWFSTPPYCSNCLGLFRREDGYWFSASIFNYIFSALLGLALFFVWVDGWPTSNAVKVVALAAFVVAFLVLFFPFARAVVLAIDLAVTGANNDDYLDTYNGPNRKIRRLRDQHHNKGSDP